MITVSEIFGPTFQGEGPRIGRRCAFVRLMACNLSCSWCDTPYTWDASRFNLKDEGANMTAEDVAAAVDALNVSEVVLSGGEPLLHQKRPDWSDMLKLLGKDRTVTVETNGTIIPTIASQSRIDFFMVSPKLAHAGDPYESRINPDALWYFAAFTKTNRVGFKFVAQEPDDLKQVHDLCAEYQIPPKCVWIMPEGVTAEVQEQRMADLAQPVLDAGFHMSSRLHVLLWGDRRGV